jgi:hypothetical protein
MPSREGAELILDSHDTAGEEDEEGDEGIECGLGSGEQDDRTGKGAHNAGGEHEDDPATLPLEFFAISE